MHVFEIPVVERVPTIRTREEFEIQLLLHVCTACVDIICVLLAVTRQSHGIAHVHVGGRIDKDGRIIAHDPACRNMILSWAAWAFALSSCVLPVLSTSCLPTK